MWSRKEEEDHGHFCHSDRFGILAVHVYLFLFIYLHPWLGVCVYVYILCTCIHGCAYTDVVNVAFPFFLISDLVEDLSKL